MGKGACIIASGYHGSVNLSVVKMTTALPDIARETLLEMVCRADSKYSWAAKVADSIGLSARFVRAIVYGEKHGFSRSTAREIASQLRDCSYAYADELDRKACRLRALGDALNAEIIQSKRQMEQDARRPDNSHAAGLALARRQVAQDRRLGSSQSQATHAHGRPVRPHASSFAHHVRSHEAAA